MESASSVGRVIDPSRRNTATPPMRTHGCVVGNRVTSCGVRDQIQGFDDRARCQERVVEHVCPVVTVQPDADSGAVGNEAATPIASSVDKNPSHTSTSERSIANVLARVFLVSACGNTDLDWPSAEFT